jgi:hypothetical protein
MCPAANSVIGLSISSRTERGFVIAALGGEPAMAFFYGAREAPRHTPVRGQPTPRRPVGGNTRTPDACRLGGHRPYAGLLGGFLISLAVPERPTPWRTTGLDHHLDIFPAVSAACPSAAPVAT